jgi:predicted DCC family thiol-disulfide oxidoreductase YuxK
VIAHNGLVSDSGPTLVYDGDCGFCTTCVAFIHRRLPTDAHVVAWQHADLDALGVSRQQAQRKVQWVDGGAVCGGHQAVGRLLLDAGGWWAIPGRLALTPPFSWVAALLYKVVADNRHRLPGGTPACALPPDQRPGAGDRSGAVDSPER